jgi:hypothetical protein
VAEYGVTASEEGADDVEDEEDDGGEEAEATKKKGIDITPDSQFLVIKTVLFHPKDESVRATVVGAILGSFQRKPLKDGKTSKSFKLRRQLLFRLADQVTPATASGALLTQRIPKAMVESTATSIERCSLASIRSEDDIRAFVDKLVNQF